VVASAPVTFRRRVCHRATRNVIAALAKRRHPNRDDVQPKEEIGTAVIEVESDLALLVRIGEWFPTRRERGPL
jgi:hypothetical protein